MTDAARSARGRRARAAAAALCLPLLLASAVAAPAAAAGPYAAPERVFALPVDDLDEVSGLVASRTSPGALWVHEDQGNAPTLTALGPDGRPRLRLFLAGRDSTDWEDLAVSRAGDGCATRLVVADSGDGNDATGSGYGLVLVDEPVVPSAGYERREVGSTYVRTRLLEGDREVRRDAEALLVHPVTGEVGVVTKSPGNNTRLFSATAAELDAAARSDRVLDLRLRREWDLPVGPGEGSLVTGGDVAAGGDRVVLRTYERVYEYPLGPEEPLAAAFGRTPATYRPGAADLAAGTGEAIAYDASGSDLLLTYEGPFAEVSRLAGSGAAAPATCVSRVGDATAVARSAALSAATYAPGTTDAVVLARSDVYADGLSGAPLAAQVGGPVLLTPGDELPPGVAAEIARLGAEKAYLLGGTAALSSDLESDVRRLGLQTERLSGADRYETNADVVRELVRLRGGPATAAVVALGGGRDVTRDWADALAAGPLAGQLRAPVLLVRPTDVPPPVARVLADAVRPGSFVFVAGGLAAVDGVVSQELRDQGWQVERRGGANRYETAVLLAQEAVRQGAGDDVVLAVTGRAFADALSAGPAALASGGVLLLVDPFARGTDPARTDASVYDYVRGLSDGLREVRVVGDEETVPAAVEVDLRVATRG